MSTLEELFVSFLIAGFFIVLPIAIILLLDHLFPDHLDGR